MQATIDKAGRLVIPKPLRDALGLVPGPVELVRDGAAVRIEPVKGHGASERRGRFVIDDAVPLDDETVRGLRLADQS